MATQRAIAEHLTLSTRNITLLNKKDIFQKGCTLDEAREGYIKYLQDLYFHRNNEGEYNLAEEKARLTHYQAEQTKIELAMKEETVIPVEDVLTEWTKMVSSFRAKMLAMPTRLTPILEFKQDSAEIHNILKDAVYEALTELSQGQ